MRSVVSASPSVCFHSFSNQLTFYLDFCMFMSDVSWLGIENGRHRLRVGVSNDGIAVGLTAVLD